MRSALLAWLFLGGIAMCAPGAAEWEERADAARFLSQGRRASTARALAELPAERRAVVEAALAPLVALEPGLAGVREARERYLQGRKAARDPASKADRSPSSSAYQAAAGCVLAGLVARSGPVVAAGPDPEGDAVQLLLAVRALEVIGEPDASWLVEELAQALPEALYVHALREAR